MTEQEAISVLKMIETHGSLPTNAKDEAIAKYKNKAEEHEQIAEWLEDYKHIKQWKSDIMDSFCKYDVSSFEELIANARNKAIDDFLKKLYKIGEHRDFDWEDMYELAEQLKAGGK